MKKNTFFDFLWWFSTPFFITFFFILILLYSQGPGFMKTALLLFILLVVQPVLWDWILKAFYKLKFIDRQKFIAIIYFVSYAYILLKYHNILSSFVFYSLLIFAVYIIISYIFLFLKLNQFSFLLGGFLAVTFLISISQTTDLQIIIITELLLSAALSYFFIDENIDNLKGTMLTYLSGFLIVALNAFIFNFIL